MDEDKYAEIFENPPLKTVSCEIRFPAFLKISEKIPDFQAEIRNDLPEFYPQSIPVVTKTGMFDETSWIFKSSRQDLTLRIRTSNITLISNDYRTFNPFFEDLKKYFGTFFKLNKIDLFSRIGLRYINIEEFREKEPNIELILRYFNLDKFLLKVEDGIHDFQIQFNKKEDEYFLNTIFNYKPQEQGNYAFIFDFDSFFLGDLKLNNSNPDYYFKIIKNLHFNILQAFNNAITEDYKNEILRVKNK